LRQGHAAPEMKFIEPGLDTALDEKERELLHPLDRFGRCSSVADEGDERMMNAF
jgi:hypothetical protein